LIDTDSCFIHRLAADLFHGADGNFKDFLPVHRDGVLVSLDGFRPRWFERTASGNIELLDVRTIGPQLGAENSTATVF